MSGSLQCGTLNSYLLNSATTLPSSIVSSSLTSVGILTGLSIGGSIGITGQQTITNNSANPQTTYKTSATNYMDVGVITAGGNSFMASYGTRDLDFYTNGTNIFTLKSNGNTHIHNNLNQALTIESLQNDLYLSLVNSAKFGRIGVE